MSGFVITTPVSDDITHYLREWSSEIIEDAKDRGVDCGWLDYGKVTKDGFRSELSRKSPSFIVLNGHADSEGIKGDSEIILSNENAELTKNRIIYARACESVGTLGKSCMDKGAIAYIGYENSFYLLYNGSMVTRAREDEVARPFMEVSNAIPLAIIKGNTVEQALEKSKIKFLKWVEHYKTHPTLEGEHVIPILALNMVFQRAIGESSASMS